MMEKIHTDFDWRTWKSQTKITKLHQPSFQKLAGNNRPQQPLPSRYQDLLIKVLSYLDLLLQSFNDI